MEVIDINIPITVLVVADLTPGRKGYAHVGGTAMILRIVCKKAFPVEEFRGEEVEVCHGFKFWMLGDWVTGWLGY